MEEDKDITQNDFKDVKRQGVQSIKVIGVGGGGCNAVEHMFEQGIKDVSFVLINTDRQVLVDSAVPTKLVIGPGLGAGGKPERARDYAEQNAEAIADLFDATTDMVFVTAGMGGGTGTGAGPVVARIAKEKGILTVGIVTVPFLFEGGSKVIKALQGAEEMGKNVDSLLVINNERLNDIYKDLSIFNAFAKADDTLLTAAQSITDIITNRGVINRDFNDVDTTLREGGTAIISTGYGEGEHRVTKAIEDALHSPLLKDTDVYGSKKLLMVLYVSDNPDYPYNVSENHELTDFIARLDPEVEVMWGLYKDSTLDQRVKITILASGFEVTVSTDPTQRRNPEPKPRQQSRLTPDDDRRIRDIYGTSAGTQGTVLNPDDYDNDESGQLDQIERGPAVTRRGGFINRPLPRQDNDRPAPAPRRDDNRGDNTIMFDDI